MPDDIVARLRKAKGLDLDLKQEAADKIERLSRLGTLNGDIDRLLDCIDSSQRTLIFEQESEIRRLRLTDAEREAIEAAIAYMAPVANYDSTVQATLRGLLERLK